VDNEPNSAHQQQKANGSARASNILKTDAGQKAYNRAQKTYEATKRLGKRLRETAARLTASEWMTAILTAAIAAATVWNVVVVETSVGIMRGQLIAMKVDQRPWVGISFADYPPNPVQLGFKNTGKFPAMNVSIKAFAWQPSSQEASPILPTDRCTVDCKISGVEMPPEMPFQFILMRPAQDTVVWLVGRVDYEDSAGIQHKTGICLIHFPETHDLRSCPGAGSNYAD
jgi:hypothetical protein